MVTDSGSSGEASVNEMTGASAGFTLRKLGGAGSSAGRRRRVAVICDCTSRAAPSMLRSRSNCMTMLALPFDERDVISATPGIVANARSSGAATEVAIVSGFAPGNWADTEIVG